MSTVPTAKPKKPRRSLEEQIVALDLRRKREVSRAHTRELVNVVRSCLMDRSHRAALSHASELVDALEVLCELDGADEKAVQ